MTSQKKPTLMVIDGHSLAFRAFYALPVDSFQTAAGFHTNAIHGFISMLLSLLAKEQPDSLAVAFDISRYSFRTELYPEYKGTRGETPEEFKGQVPMLQEALHAMGITTLEKEGYEADDILATLATNARQDGYRVLVVSGDRDTIQLVNDDVTLLYPSKQGVSELTRYDIEKVEERYGIRPEQYPEVAALVGETSDNLPGVPKVGEKTAVKWLREYGSLQSILENQQSIGGKVGESLRENAHLAVRNRQLNELVRDVELGITASELTRGPIDMDAVRTVFAKLEFRTLLQRVTKLAQDSGQQVEESHASTGSAEDSKSSQNRTPPEAKLLLDEELEAWLDRQSEAHPSGLAVHFFSDGASIRVGVASSDECIEFDWSTGARDTLAFENWLGSIHPKIFFDLKDALSRIPALRELISSVSGDLMVAGWLLRPQSPDKSLPDAVLRFTQVELPQPDPNQLIPAEESSVGLGALAWHLFHSHERVLKLLDPGSLDVYRTIELPLVPLLSALEVRGVQVNITKLQSLFDEFSTRALECQAAAFKSIGREINLGSPKQLQELLFNELNMPKTRATKTGYTTDAAALAELQQSNPHPFLDALLAHRDSTKMKQIVEGLLKSVGDDQRIHTTYVQIGTTTGRLSSTDPNLQNIPIRTEDGRRIRDVFESADEYECLLSADYSQIEMRIMAHLSQDAGLIEAFNAGEDLHRYVGSRIFGVQPDAVTPEMRSKVKAMSYGLVYGLSAFGLAKQLNISSADAKALMSDYFARFGGVRDYLRNVVDEARQKKKTVTQFGRVRPFPDLGSPNRQVRENAERAALNAPIQGTAADIMKKAMLDVETRVMNAGLQSRMLLQIHDELVFEVAKGELDRLSEIVTESMERVVQLDVPLEVQIGTGRTWFEAAH